MKVSILADSIAPTGSRLTTFMLTYQRFIHSEFMTHRCFSRNASSSRAIPIHKMQKAVLDNPAMPAHWGENMKGMQAQKQLGEIGTSNAIDRWVIASKKAVEQSKALELIGVHKQIANRVLEPFSEITVIATSEQTGLINFFMQRANPEAQPEFQALAYEMLRQWLDSPRKVLKYGEWHMPMVDDFKDRLGIEEETLLAIATGRIARVSYLNHNGIKSTEDDIDLHDKLIASGHWSPFEHCAQAVAETSRPGNFGRCWRQYRKQFQNECRSASLDELLTLLSGAPDWVFGD